jgi:uncharacterized membrane protein YphA (DoxX/SURF4 family)
VNRYNRGLMIVARILVAMVFILNGFGIINQAIPAKEMMERGVPPAIVPLFMIAGRLLEIVAGFGLALGLFPRWCALALFRWRRVGASGGAGGPVATERHIPFTIKVAA